MPAIKSSADLRNNYNEIILNQFSSRRMEKATLPL